MKKIVNRMKTKICCIYKIECESGVYVGATRNYGDRKYSHRRELKIQVHHCKPLLSAYNNGEKLRSKILLKCSPEISDQELWDLEAEYWDTQKTQGKRMLNARPGNGQEKRTVRT